MTPWAAGGGYRLPEIVWIRASPARYEKCGFGSPNSYVPSTPSFLSPWTGRGVPMPKLPINSLTELKSSRPRNALVSACILLLLVSNAWCQSKARSEPKAGSAAKARAESRAESGASHETVDAPLISVDLPNIDHFYSDLKLLFDLAGDQKGLKTLKDTINEFLVGVETGKSGGVRVYSMDDGLRTVASLPIKSEADFKKFLENLYDLDVKTAPPPKPALASQVPKKVQADLKSLKLDSHERLVFGLYEGVLKYETGEVLIGDTLESVRLAKAGSPAELAKGVSLSVRFDGTLLTPEQRREALKKTRGRLLQNVKKWESETDAEFGHRKAMIEQALTDVGNFLADASQSRLNWVTSHEKKQAHVDIETTADAGSPLAKRIERIGQTPDAFAGISKEGCVAWAAINLPLDEQRQESIKTVSKHSHAAAKERIESDARNPSRRAQLTDLDDLISSIADDVAAMPEFNGCLRTWSNKAGTLTSVGAVRVSDTTRVMEFLQKLKGHSHEGETVKLKVASEAGVDIHQVTNAQWQKDYPELFDDEGSVYVGTSDKAVWYALGEQGLERLKQAISEAGHGAAKSGPGEFRASLLPLAEVWNKIQSRQSPSTGKAKVKKEKVKEAVQEKHPKAAQAASVVRDLDLSKLAVEAFPEGTGHDFDDPLKQEGYALADRRI